MIEGVRLYASGVTADGDYLDTQHVVLAVNVAADGTPDAEITLEDGSTYSVDLAELKRALAFALSTYRARAS